MIRKRFAAAVAACAALSLASSLPATAAPGEATPVQPDAQAFTPIELRYWTDAGLRELLGNPVDTEYVEGDISYQHFQNGWLYHSPATGVHELHGDIAQRFVRSGAHRVLGVPTTDEVATPDGVGSYNHFTRDASVYWSPSTGAQTVAGTIRKFWSDKGWEASRLGYPTSSTASTPDGVGVYNHFVGGDGAGASVYWTKATGAHSVQGAIRDLWAANGWENGFGYPSSDELTTLDGLGRQNEFTGKDDPPAAAYWHPASGAHFVTGAIMLRWHELRRELSYLGYPTSNPYEAADGRTQVDFEGGYIAIDQSTGAVIDQPW
ncbi:LGFP repeat-containing protein [Saccharopolyspora erythraea]|uniref:LGFP repeat-containing protein n=1 Tax=Saccharopolyspora erythraea TaxID=1836 RepID=UPI00201209C8|nr:hypothetical protein [Saccharopolyspora erythraea]